MRILEIETFGRGGLLHYAYNLSCALAERGHEVTLMTTERHELEDADVPAGLRLLPKIARWRPASPWLVRAEALFDAAATALAARRLAPDVVHLHCTNSIALVYVVLLRLLGLRLVTTAHVVTPHERMPLERPVYRLIHRLPHLVVAHSKVDETRLRDEFGVPPARLAVIPHGEYGFFARSDPDADADADADRSRSAARRELGLDDDAEVALFFGYLREYKGLDVLLDAWERIVDAGDRPAARLVIAGDPVRLTPSRRRELESRARDLGAICRFEYVPFDDVAAYFAAADVLVMPYRRISQSGVLFLALALGVPLVASRVGALPEMLEHGQNALLVPPEDPAALADALARALGDADLRRRLAEGGRRVAEAHSWPSIAATTETAIATAFAADFENLLVP